MWKWQGVQYPWTVTVDYNEIQNKLSTEEIEIEFATKQKTEDTKFMIVACKEWKVSLWNGTHYLITTEFEKAFNLKNKILKQLTQITT